MIRDDFATDLSNRRTQEAHMTLKEANTCRKYLVPKLQEAGWDAEPYAIDEQITFTDGRVIVAERTTRRKKGKRADYILRYRPDMPIAVILTEVCISAS